MSNNPRKFTINIMLCTDTKTNIQFDTYIICNVYKLYLLKKRLLKNVIGKNKIHSWYLLPVLTIYYLLIPILHQK